MSTLYLIRHGEIPRSEPHRLVGQQNLPLTAQGREQIARLAEYLTTCSVAGLVTSPLTRCLTSADMLQARLEQDCGCVNVVHRDRTGFRLALLNFRP